MKKIISLFQRSYDGDRMVRDEVVPGAEWVLANEGNATRKFDGTCCMVRAGKLYRRYEVKDPRQKIPDNFEPANDVDTVTGKQQGWIPVGDGAQDVYYREAWDNQEGWYLHDGTYELCGPKIQGNPENMETHVLIRHGEEMLGGFKLTFDGIKEYLRTAGIEGIVWHHPDGRMVKIKRKDFFK